MASNGGFCQKAVVLEQKVGQRMASWHQKKLPKPLIYKAKKERPATKRQKQHLHDLLKYHRIKTTVDIDHMSGNEISRMIDQIIFTHGRIPDKA